MVSNMKIVAVVLLIAAASALGGCGSSDAGARGDGVTGADGKADGVYTGVSSEDDSGAYGEVSITVEDGVITACSFVTWQKDGSVKDEDYGKVNGEISNRDFYDKAQLAVRAMSEYADALVETQSPNSVDAVSGATIAHGQFLEAVADAFSGDK
jgi:major membrane immunogen (membrane-anchored lipoprotein)